MLTRTLFHIWGPLYIYTYGVFLAIGCYIVYYLILQNNERKKIINDFHTTVLFNISIVMGVIGARICYLMNYYDSFNSLTDIYKIHQGGLSLLGAVIILLMVIPLYLYIQAIPLLPILDLVGLYAPLLQAVARLGCFFAGCCYGKPTTLFWAVQYSNPDTLAPLCSFIHPTQLYSAFISLLLFLCLYYYSKRITKKLGHLFCYSLFFSSLSRFFIDFLRGDQEFCHISNILSIHQWMSLGLIICSIIMYIYISRNKRAAQ